MKIYVVGHRGLVGSALVRAIESGGEHTWIGKTRQELDLLDKKAVLDYLIEEKPDSVIIAAAKVGGIGANSKYPVDFLSENLQIELNLINSAHEAGIEKLVFLGSSCIYPKEAPQPIKEEYLLTGPLEPTNEPYAIAKIAGLKLVEAYRKQYGYKWISLMPTNLYGPGDNYDLETSHVLPALIRKFHEAKVNGDKQVTLWGTGEPLREFLHSDDLADATLFCLSNYDGDEALNVGSGEEVSIRQLAEAVSSITGFEGSVFWDSSKPNGTFRKALDSNLIDNLGWTSKKDLMEGLRQTYENFLHESRKVQV